MPVARPARRTAPSSRGAGVSSSKSTISRSDAVKALVTGFEPFAGDSVNPALEALGRLPPRLGALEVMTQVLPAVFGQALDVLETAVAATNPDIVLCVGLAGGRAALSLERVAINIDDARIADNAGRQPID